MDPRDYSTRGHDAESAGAADASTRVGGGAIEPGGEGASGGTYESGAETGRAGASDTGYAGIAPAGSVAEQAHRTTESATRRWRTTESEPGGRGSDDESRTLQDRVSDVLSIRSLDDLGAQVRENPLATIGVAVGVGFLLHRAGLLDTFLAPLGRGESAPDDLSPAEERLLAWLNDAYALEKALIPVLKNHAEDARRRPKVRRRDLEHLEQTRRHAKKVRQCIEHLGAKPSKTKEAIGRFSGMMNSVATEPFDDEVVRNFLADYAAENLEIASYRAIIAAAHEAGHPKIARICQDILGEEEEMADWLRDNLADAVRDTFEELGMRRG